MAILRSIPTGMSLVGAVLALGLTPSTAVAGEEAAAAPAQQAATDKDDPNRVVCRRLPVVGSISRVKVCKSAAQWAKEAGQVDARAGEALQSTRGGVQVGG